MSHQLRSCGFSLEPLVLWVCLVLLVSKLRALHPWSAPACSAQLTGLKCKNNQNAKHLLLLKSISIYLSIYLCNQSKVLLSAGGLHLSLGRSSWRSGLAFLIEQRDFLELLILLLRCPSGTCDGFSSTRLRTCFGGWN